jgi:hypothetical protein
VFKQLVPDDLRHKLRMKLAKGDEEDVEEANKQLLRILTDERGAFFKPSITILLKTSQLYGKSVCLQDFDQQDFKIVVIMKQHT